MHPHPHHSGASLSVGLIIVLALVLFACCSTCSAADDIKATQQQLLKDLRSPDADVTRIGFGSCNKHDRPQPLWAKILEYKPQVWVWLGDAVYLDTWKVMPFNRQPSSLPVMKKKYDAQKKRREYRALLDRVPVVGVWDDHDYGENDGNMNYVDRVEAQKLYLDFLDFPDEHPLRKQRGIYQSITVGKPGRRTKLLLLDNRYFQTEPGPDGDMLGEAQWSFLEKELREADGNDVKLVVIGSGTQILSTNKHLGEGWKNFPKSRTRLYRLIVDANQRQDGPAVMLLSGDVHMAEITKRYMCDDEANTAYAVYDATSSGMTHCWGASPILPRVLVHKAYETISAGEEFYLYYNFGTITIDWDSPGQSVVVDIRGDDGAPKLSLNTSIKQLRTPIDNTHAEHERAMLDCKVTKDEVYGTNGVYISGVRFAMVVFTCIVSVMVLSLAVCVYCCCCRSIASKPKTH